MFLIFIFFYLLACDSVYPFNQFFFYFFLISLHAAISAVKFFLPEGYTLHINTSTSDQHRISPYNINTLSTR